MQAALQIVMVVRMNQPDFIQITDNAVSAADCAAIVQRMRDSQQLHPGRIGGGVFPDLKHSRDRRISGVAEWLRWKAGCNRPCSTACSPIYGSTRRH